MLTETGTRHRRRRHPVLWLLLLAALLLGTALATAIAPGAGRAGLVRADDAAPPAPSGVTAVDGNTPGVVVLAWDAVPDAAYYRIGWVSSERV